MRKTLLTTCAALVFATYGVAHADTMTDDSTNTYTDSKQHNEKLHQKPVANDANSGADMSTTKDTSGPTKQQRLNKKHNRAHKHDASAPKVEQPTTTGNGTTTGNTGNPQ